MADELETAPQTEEASTETAPNEGQETEWNAEVLDFVRSRKEDLENEEPGTEAPEGQEVEAAPAKEPEKEAPAPEGQSKAARRALAREKKLRAERESFAAEQEAWKSETEEGRAKAEAFEQSKANLHTNPLAHLTEAGMSESEIMDLAREIYYKHMPEQATPAVQAEMAAIQRERRLKKLEAQGKAKDEPEEKAPAGPTPEYQAYEAQYRSNLNQFAATVDVEEFPLSAAYAKEDFNDLVQGMFTAASQSAQASNGTRGDLSPQECMAAVERFLQARQPAATPATETPQTEETAAPNRKATLRNKTTAAVPNEKHRDDMSYEEIKEESRRRFHASMREGNMIRD